MTGDARSRAAGALIRLGALELDVASEVVRIDGCPIPMAPQPRRVLLYLATHRDRVVTRAELRRALWDDRFVEFDQALNFAIRQIRRALSVKPGLVRVIVTERGRGYRFDASRSSSCGEASTSPTTGAPMLRHVSRLLPFREMRRWSSQRLTVSLAVIAIMLWGFVATRPRARHKTGQPVAVHLSVTARGADANRDSSALSAQITSALTSIPGVRLAGDGEHVARLLVDLAAGPHGPRLEATLRFTDDPRPRWRVVASSQSTDLERLSRDIARDAVAALAAMELARGTRPRADGRVDAVVVTRGGPATP